MAHFSGYAPDFDRNYKQNVYGRQISGVKSKYLSEPRGVVSTSFGTEKAPVYKQDKIKEGWKPYVHQQGDLFYVDVNGTKNGKSSQNPETRQKNWTYNHRNQYSQKENINDGENYLTNIVQRANGHDIGNELPHTGENRHLDYVHHNNNNNYKHFKPKILFSDRHNITESEDCNCNEVISDLTYQSKHTHNGSSLSSANTDKIKHVYLMPNLKNCQNGDSSGKVLCEKLFGIILCQYNNKTLNGTSLDKVMRERKIIVQDVVPGSSADESCKIHRGDMLLCINDVEVSTHGLDQIFRSISNKQVKLTFQVPVVIGPKQPPSPMIPSYAVPKTNPVSFAPDVSTTKHSKLPPKTKTQFGENILQLVSGESKPGFSSFLQNCMCAVMYLTLQSSESGTNDSNFVMEDILYQFPGEINKLTEVRGLFLTLCGIMPDVTANMAKSCTIIHQGQKYNLVFLKEDQDLFIVGLPESRVPLLYLEHIMEDLQQLLAVMFGAVTSSFKDSKNHGQLDQLFSLMLHSILQNPEVVQHGIQSSHSSTVFWESLPGVRYLDLSEENKLLCSEILSEFEAADFDDVLEDEDFENRRSFTILGTCLFYKEYLLCNHMTLSDLKDVQLFLKYHSLLHLISKKSVEELVIWKEIYLTRRCQKPQQSTPGFSEPQGKWFLMIIGMKHFLLATILEAGGCTKPQKGWSVPDAFYVSQAKATLLQFETDDVSMADCCENRLQSESVGPTLVSADSILCGQKPKKEETLILSPLKPQGSPRTPATLVKSPSNSSFFKWSFSPYFEPKSGVHDEVESDRISYGKGNNSSYAGSDTSTPVMKRQGSRISYGSNDSAGSGSSVGVGNKQGKQISKAGSVFDMSSINQSFSEDKILHNIKVTGGAGNVFFHYVKFDSVDGVYIGPTPREIASSQGTVQTQVLHNFYKTCLYLHKGFKYSNSSKTEEDTKDSSKFGKKTLLHKFQEQGTMFRYTPVSSPDSKKTPLSLNYWVIGRRFLNGKEIYACFHESVPQVAIEMAFRMDFGT